MIGVLRIRGSVGVKPDARKSMELLRLKNLYSLAVVEDNPSMKGVVKKAKDYVTWGELSEDTLKALKKLKHEGDKVKLYRLHPPRGGFKRTVKRPRPKGEIGYRGEEINSLIKRMLP